ncbi:MAG: hypothetical protein M3Z64_08665 [Verrucomicrobiota bacterium]|nr:hypothetical protein [Verrucomicrobiota bacterium]
MTGFAAQLLILSWAALSIFSVGIALCHRFTRLRGLELIAYGAAAGVFVHAAFGVSIALDWHLRHVTAIGLLVCGTLALAYLARLKIWRELGAELNGQARASLAIWVAFVLACLAVVHLDVRWPTKLPDGRYIFKTHTSNVKVQYLTGLPSDNYIPYLVSEFFARRISFQEVRPILPGNEISNRTILMSLVDLPFRTLLARHEKLPRDLGKFDYIGARWPDVAKLNDDSSFDQFFPVGVLLNALLLLALLAFISHLYHAAALATGSLLYATSPYLIGQTIFTWPKALAGFFLVLCWNSMRRGHDAKVVALLAALAFHSHPASIVAAACLGVWYLIDARRARATGRFREKALAPNPRLRGFSPSCHPERSEAESRDPVVSPTVQPRSQALPCSPC